MRGYIWRYGAEPSLRFIFNLRLFGESEFLKALASKYYLFKQSQQMAVEGLHTDIF